MTYIYLLFIIILIVISFIFINNSLKNSIIENYTGIMTDNFYEEVSLKNYKLNRDDKTITNCDSNNNCITKSYKKHFNSDESIKLAKNKIKTSEALQKNGIPIPKFLQIDLLKDDANKIIQRMNQLKILFPIILKPVNGTFGIDVITNIDNKEELIKDMEGGFVSPHLFIECMENIQERIKF
jgi:glutathione synthase/RimK-type ligase-like ATP-grasp enzyme